MKSLATIFGICFFLMNNGALSHYLPQVGHQPHWSALYWPSPLSDPSSSYRSLHGLIERVNARSIGNVKRLLNPKRPEVLDALDEWDTIDEASNNETSPSFRNDYRSFDVRPFVKERPASRPFRVRNEFQNNKQLDNLGRFLYIGAGNVNAGNPANYLFKTSYVFSSAAVTVCVVSTCIPADQFAVGGSTVTCRRKRTLAVLDSNVPIEPSNVEKVDSTALPESLGGELFTLPSPAATFESPRRSETVLKPSFTVAADDDVDDDEVSSVLARTRQRRFLFLLTTTITTYSFVTSTFTYSLRLYSNNNQNFDGRQSDFAFGLLTCRPSNIGLC